VAPRDCLPAFDVLMTNSRKPNAFSSEAAAVDLEFLPRNRVLTRIIEDMQEEESIGAQVDIEGAANRKAVLDEHRSFLVTKSQLAAEDNSKRVCAKPDCRKEYDPSKLPNNKRCSFPRCSAVFECLDRCSEFSEACCCESRYDKYLWI
jgi:hypothetical protein